MSCFVYIVFGLLLYAFAAAVYLGCNKGMARNARGQQLRRLLIAAVVAVLPMAMGGLSPASADVMVPLCVGAAWMVTYPLLYHLTYRRSSPDYENYMDTTFGLYLFGWLVSANILARLVAPGSTAGAAILTLVEFALCVPLLFQWIYYAAYKVCVDANGMKIVQETNVNEIIEYFHSFPLWASLGAVALVAAVAAALGMGNAHLADGPMEVAQWRQVAAAAMLLTGIYIYKPHHGVFMRTGMAELYTTVKDYVRSNDRYRSETGKRLATLSARQLGAPWPKPTTIIMVIGESACRDYMSAYHPEMDHDTTPWVRREAETDEGFTLFPNAYSCAMQTVPTLERALTERNQYNDKSFFRSCSVVDMARRLGYRIHWYSNQGHLGTFDTPVTLVADTADVAKWTKQEVGKVQYDETLLSFFDEVDPNKNNLVVFHLKGSHFNFLNRYPPSFTRWGRPGVQDNVVNYENSIAYTDTILQRIFDEGRRRFNLQAMVYFSDHATEPGRRRKPNFDGFQMTRIPLFVWTGDDYRRLHPDRYAALRANRDKYFTNDLAYDLVCGVLDAESNCFDHTQSLAWSDYRFGRGDLLTYEGRKHISEDDGHS